MNSDEQFALDQAIEGAAVDIETARQYADWLMQNLSTLHAENPDLPSAAAILMAVKAIIESTDHGGAAFIAAVLAIRVYEDAQR